MNHLIYPLKFESQLSYKKKLPSLKKIAELVGCDERALFLIYDRKLRSLGFFKNFLAQAKTSYAVKAGENLKELDQFSGHIRNILSALEKAKLSKPHVLAIGGGSLGDFAGFFASTFKRGVPLTHMPTTLLSALDSAHGGKTALNVKKYKNQIGSYYPAQNILIVREFYESLPESELSSALGEVIKMVFIEGKDLIDPFEKAQRLDLTFLWKHLPELIAAKLKIVRQDPFEQTGIRRQLNLGHSLGHVIELEYGLSHGEAVSLGLDFAINWSLHRGYLSIDSYQRCERFLDELVGGRRLKVFFAKKKKLRKSRLIRLFQQDKKSTGSQNLDFVFLKEIGEPFIKNVDLESIAFEARRQEIVE